MVPRALISKGSVFFQVQQLTCPLRRRKEDSWPLQETQEMRVQPLGWEDSPGGGDGNFTAQFSMLVFSAFLVSLHRGAARFPFLERSSFPSSGVGADGADKLTLASGLCPPGPRGSQTVAVLPAALSPHSPTGHLL